MFRVRTGICEDIENEVITTSNGCSACAWYAPSLTRFWRWNWRWRWSPRIKLTIYKQHTDPTLSQLSTRSTMARSTLSLSLPPPPSPPAQQAQSTSNYKPQRHTNGWVSELVDRWLGLVSLSCMRMGMGM